MKKIDQLKPAVKAYTIENLEDFKWWRLQNKLAADLLREIIFRWRGSNAKVPGDASPWVAYPHRRWRIWLGNISESTFERTLKKLVDTGLIERERHQFAGTTVCAFLRPTVLALTYMGRPEDIARLVVTAKASKPLKTKHFDGTLDGTDDGTGDGTLDGTDLTTFPSLSTVSNYSNQKEGCHSTEKGKGKAGEEVKGKIKIIHIPAKAKVTAAPVVETPPIDDDDLEFNALCAKVLAAKAKNQAKFFPELKGAHEKAVKHPSKNPKWSSLSHEVKTKLYLKYEEYVANWYKGKKGKPYADETMSDEEWAAVQSSIMAAIEEDA